MTSFKGDYTAQLQSQENVIVSLHSELDILNHTNNDKSQESVEITETTQGVKIEISSRDSDIREFQQEISTTVMHNQGIERENENCRNSICDSQDVRQRQQSTIYQNNGALSKWEQECFAQNTRINVLEKERQTLIQRVVCMDE